MKWKPGALCQYFDEKERRWADGEVIGLFSDGKGDWIKVRCGQTVHDVLCDAPTVRPRASDMVTISMDKMKELQAAAVGTKVDELLQWILPSDFQQKLSGKTTR